MDDGVDISLYYEINGKAEIKMYNDILDRVNKVFRELFEDDDLTVTGDTTAEDIEDWDSFMHINLIKMIEDEFQIEFGVSQLVSFEKVSDIIDAINDSLGKD